MNFSDRLEYGVIKGKWGNGDNLTDTDIALLFAIIDSQKAEIEYLKTK